MLPFPSRCRAFWLTALTGFRSVIEESVGSLAGLCRPPPPLPPNAHASMTLQDNLRRYQTGHYIRAYVPLDIANPAPLGGKEGRGAGRAAA